MAKPRLRRRSYLFTLRLWLEDLGDGKYEWRGNVKEIDSGAESNFRDWLTLPKLIQSMLPRRQERANTQSSGSSQRLARHDGRPGKSA